MYSRSDLEEKSRLEEVRQRQIAEVVASETESMKNRIRQEDIGRAVEEALANPVDYEYAIDTEGHMYRYTFDEVFARFPFRVSLLKFMATICLDHLA